MDLLRKRYIIISVLLLTLIMLYIIPHLPITFAQTQNVVFRVGWGGTSFDTFNPFTTYAQISLWSTSDVYDYLVRFNKDYSLFIPDLAESWEVNSTTALFHLVKNATFHDGIPVTAEDVKYSFELASQKWSRLQPNVEMITSIEIKDNYTIVFKYKQSALFMVMAATNIPIVPKHIWMNVTDPATYSDYPLVGSGPFKVTNYKEGQYIELERNDKFFRMSWIPKVDKIIITFFSDSTSAANALRAGDIDAVGPTITPAIADSIRGNPNFNVITAPGVLYYYLAFNTYPTGKGNPTLRDKIVRQALAHAVNVTYLAELAWHGYAKPLATDIPSSNIFYNPNIKPYAFNLSLAAQMLDNAGYKVGPNNIRVSPNGVPMKYTLLVPSNMPEAIRAAQQIAAWWSKINVVVDVQAMDTGSMASIIWTKVNNTITLGHDLDLWDWFVSPADPTIFSVFLSTQIITGTSDSGYTNPEYDKLYDQMISAPSLNEVKNKAWQLQEMLHEDLPYLPLYEVLALQAYNNRFTGFYLDWPGGPFGGNDWTLFLKVQLVSTTTSPTTTLSTATSPTTTTTITTTATTTAPVGAEGYTLWIVGIVVILVIIAIVYYILRGRRV
jgi:peptide/nickel transport system substrate-binding protein